VQVVPRRWLNTPESAVKCHASALSRFAGLSAIREAKEKGASHDYLRQVFIEFSRKTFKVDPVDVELERYLLVISRLACSSIRCRLKTSPPFLRNLTAAE